MDDFNSTAAAGEWRKVFYCLRCQLEAFRCLVKKSPKGLDEERWKRVELAAQNLALARRGKFTNQSDVGPIRCEQ